MRIDKYLIEESHAKSRSHAQDLIEEGLVFVNEKQVKKSSMEVALPFDLRIEEPEENFASRAGYKLFQAKNPFDLDFNNHVVLDIGASTGGFCDVALQSGASYVYAVDVGHDQLVEHLRTNPKICNYEGMNARNLRREDFLTVPTMVVMDVSFISVKLLFDSIKQVVANDAIWVVLVKPQFEAGKKDVGKNGIVKDRKVHQRVLQEVTSFAQSIGLYVQKIEPCLTKGRDGNQEYIVLLTSVQKNRVFNFKELTEKK